MPAPSGQERHALAGPCAPSRAQGPQATALPARLRVGSAAVDPLTVIRRRLAVQRLSAEPLGSPVAVVRWLGAMQGQEYAEVKWSIARRMGVEVVDDVI